MERTAKSGNEGYPPFNIEQTSDRSYRITLAVAGFAESDLSITVEDRSWSFADVKRMTAMGACTCIVGSQRGNSSAASFWLMVSKWAKR